MSFPSWEGNYTKSTVELMKEYSTFREVIFIDYPYTLLDLFRNKITPIKRILGGKALINKEHPNLKIYNLPAIIPFQSIKINLLYQVIVFINAWLIKRRIAKIRATEKIIEADWLCALNPILGNLMYKEYQQESFNYYCYDDISSMQWVHKTNVEEEIKFLKNARNVFCTSKNLMEKCLKHNNKVHLIENGVNTDIFSIQTDNTIKSGIIGYVGSIDDRLDLDLLECIIKLNTSLKFKFIGRVVDEKVILTLDKYENVEFVPAMDPKLLPKHIAGFDIGIIPFIKNKFTENIFPMKVNEYLALGIPVISTNFSDLSSLDAIIKIASNSEEFNEYLETEIQSDSTAKQELRKEHAKAQSWANKAFLMHKILSNQ